MDLASLIADMNMASVIANSYHNFHTRGFDYICLHRSENYTAKLYYLEGDASKLREVVNPHDHRYGFRTHVLAGSMVDYRYTPSDLGQVFQAFDYMTPLNGGNGFTFRGEERLQITDGVHLDAGSVLETSHRHLHTIKMQSDQTVLLLEQFEDALPLDVPTSCWVRQGSPSPDTSGLYERFTEDQIMQRLAVVSSLLAARVQP